MVRLKPDATGVLARLKPTPPALLDSTIGIAVVPIPQFIAAFQFLDPSTR